MPNGLSKSTQADGPARPASECRAPDSSWNPVVVIEELEIMATRWRPCVKKQLNKKVASVLQTLYVQMK